jgi:hypothetical protein
MACTVFGHKPEFWTEGSTMRWACERCGLQAGSKTYPSSAEAEHLAAAFNRRDNEDLGKRAPLIGMFPLRLWHRLRSTRR